MVKSFSHSSLGSRSETTHRRAKTDTVDVQDYVQKYKSAYSHGLEKIYALEDVDIRSVRRIRAPEADMKVSQYDFFRDSDTEEQNAQLEFDFGQSFMSGLDHFILQEPVQVLGLSKHAEKSLAMSGKAVLKDLLETDTAEMVYANGIGQGHIDEISHKLKQYLQGKVLYQCRKVDFASWVRSLTADYEPKKNYVALEALGVANICSLSPIENMEVRRLTLEKRQEWVADAMDNWRSPKKVDRVNSDMRKTVEAFIKPWVRRRLGVATLEELSERLDLICTGHLSASAAIRFFSEVFFHGAYPMSSYLTALDKGLFTSDPSTASLYSLAVGMARRYFYKRHISYSIDELTRYVMRDSAKQWIGYPQGFLEKSLKVCPHFRVRKSESGRLMVKLA